MLVKYLNPAKVAFVAVVPILPPISGMKLGAGGTFTAQGVYIPPTFAEITSWETDEFIIPAESPGDTGVYILYRRNFDSRARRTGRDSFSQCVSNPHGRDLLIKQCNAWCANHFLRSPATGAYDITYEDSNFRGIELDGNWETPGRVHDQDGARHVRVTGCHVELMGGWLFKAMQDGGSVVFLYNVGKNITGKFTTTDWQDYPHGRTQHQMLQVAFLRHPSQFEVAWNRTYNHPDFSFIEDTYNFYRVIGTALTRLLFHHNLGDGAWINPLVVRVIDRGFRTSNTELHGSTGGFLMFEECEYGHAYRNISVRGNIYAFACGKSFHCIIEYNRALNGGIVREGMNANTAAPWANCCAYNNAVDANNSQEQSNNIFRYNQWGGTFWPPEQNHIGPLPSSGDAFAQTWKPKEQWVTQRNEWGSLQANPIIENNERFSHLNAQGELVWVPDALTGNPTGAISKQAEDILMNTWWVELLAAGVTSGPAH